MGVFTTKDGSQIYYNDWGSGQSVVFSHGWPLTADAFEEQILNQELSCQRQQQIKSRK